MIPLPASETWKDAVMAAGLTLQERRIVVLVADGSENPDIAAALGLTVNTVTEYVRSALQKTGSRNRAAMTRWHLEAATGRPLYGVPPRWPRVPDQRPAEEATCPTTA